MLMHELAEHTEAALAKKRKGIGLTTAIVAVLLTIATTIGNTANTRKIVIETKTADWWAYVHSSDSNWRLYSADARLAQQARDPKTAEEFERLGGDQKKISDDAQITAQGLEKQSLLQERIAYLSSLAELCLQLSIVLCSVSLLTDLPLFWHISFVSTCLGSILILLSRVQHS